MKLWVVFEDGKITNKARFDTDTEPAIYFNKESAIARTKSLGCQFHSYRIIKFIQHDGEPYKESSYARN